MLTKESPQEFPGVWETEDNDSKKLITRGEVAPKTGGAKHAGEYTGVYNFGDEKMLVKQGDSIGETVAEYVGGNLYQLTIPEYAAKSYLVRPEGTTSKTDVYVTSVFAKEEEGNPTVAFKAVGYEENFLFDRAIHGIKKLFRSKEESLIRKIVLDDKKNANSTLGYSVANALWHGDQDVHMGNFIRLDNEDPSKNKYVKIDHGYSFFKINKKIINIFNPFAGKMMGIHLKKAFKGEKVVEFYSINNFWDLAAEKKDFYYSGSFIKACDDIVNLTEEDIRKNLEKSLKNVQKMYGDNADKALRAFAKRIGMHSREFKHCQGDDLLNVVINYSTGTLVHRQKSLAELVEYCREKASKLTEDHHGVSRAIDEYIINLLDKKSQIEALRAKKNPTEEEVKQFRELSELQLDSRIEIYKMLSQANDLNYLTINSEGQIVLKTEFYFYNSGKSQKITLREFKDKIDSLSGKDKEVLTMIKQGIMALNPPRRELSFRDKPVSSREPSVRQRVTQEFKGDPVFRSSKTSVEKFKKSLDKTPENELKKYGIRKNKEGKIYTELGSGSLKIKMDATNESDRPLGTMYVNQEVDGIAVSIKPKSSASIRDKKDMIKNSCELTVQKGKDPNAEFKINEDLSEDDQNFVRQCLEAAIKTKYGSTEPQPRVKGGPASSPPIKLFQIDKPS